VSDPGNQLRMKKPAFVLLVVTLFLIRPDWLLFSEQDKAGLQKSCSSLVIHQAKQIVSNLKTSRYSSKTIVDEKAGTYALDCSGLACFILGKTAPESLAAVTIDPGRNHARAINFYNTIFNAPENSARNGWQRISRLLDAKPGDFIVWRKHSIPLKGNTGHMVIVFEEPVVEEDGTIRIVVMDSSRTRHAQDSRVQGSSGIGVGVLWFKVDKNGAPIALHWSSRKRKPVAYPIVIGRATKAIR
jgi:hypothetical protein